MRGIATLAAVAALVVFAAPHSRASAQEAKAPQLLVDEATAVVTELSADPHFDDIAQYIARAKAVMVVPQLLKAGFIIGGEMGDAVVLSRTADGSWSSPAFYSLIGGSIGFQAGAEAQQIIIAVMTDKGLNELMSNQFEFGVDASIAVGEVGGGVGAGSVGSLKADFVAFSRSKGLFGGGAFDGTLIRPQVDENSAYYGAGTTPKQILIDKTVSNQGAGRLKAALKVR